MALTMPAESRPAILFSAGDVSGDLYAARLAAEVHRRHPDWTLHAVGGSHLREAINGELVGDSSHMSAIGISSAVALYPRGTMLSWRMNDFVRRNRIDLAVLCDWGYFNCNQFRFFKKQRIPVLYYFPPRSWQRHGDAGLGIAPWVDRVATPFEWSARRLRRAGCNADWVGHPLLEAAPTAQRRAELRREFGVREDEKLIALLPGSRPPEVKILGPRMAAAAELLRKQHQARFIVPVAHDLVEKANCVFPAWVKILGGRARDVLAASDAAVVKTGSTTLEAAVLNVPQVAIYDFDWTRRIEWLLLWAWKRIPFIAMPNIILQRMAIPELLGMDCNAEGIAFAVGELLQNEVHRARMLADYDEVRRQLGSGLGESATMQTASIIDEMLGHGPAAKETSGHAGRFPEPHAR